MASNIKETLEVNIKLNQSSFKEIESIAANITNSFSNAGILIQNNMSTALSNVSNSMGMLGDTTQASSDDIINNVKSISSNIETLDLTIKKTSDGNNFGGLRSSVNETSDTIIQKFDGAHGAISDVIATASKFKPFEEAIKKNEAAIIAFSVAIKSAKAIVEIVNLFKGASTVIAGVSMAEQVATVSTTVLTGAVSALKIMMGGLVVGAIAALVVGLFSLSQNVGDNVKKIREQKEAIEETSKAMEEMNAASKMEFENNSAPIDLQQKYLDSLMSSIDAEGKFVGEKEKLAFWLAELNKSYPDLQLNYDEETGQIMTQNGLLSENIGLVEDLIKSKRAQAYLDAYQDDYVENLKMQKESIDQLAVAQAEYNALKEKEAKGELTGNDKKAMEEQAQTIELLKSNIQNAGVAMEEYESIASKVANKDYEGALNTIYGGNIQLYDPEKGAEQIALLEEQAATVKSQLDALAENVAEDPSMANSLSDKIEALNAQYEASKEQLALARENFDTQMKTDQEETAPTMGKDYAESYKTAAVKGMDDAGKKSGEAFETASQSYIDSIIFPDKKVKVVAEYENFDWMGGYTSNASSYIKSSFDDSQQQNESVIQPFSTGSMVGASRKIIGSLQRRVISTIKVGIPRPNLILDNAGSTAITQNVSFNQPIQKP
ncbi:MAG: hypothetical protein RR916_06120, partial [Anaerorhabdus sp.]